MSTGFEKRLLTTAYGIGEGSPDPSTQVGALISTRNHGLIPAHNSPVQGTSPNHPSLAMRPHKYRYMQHAEAAAISRAAREGLSCDGGTMAITHEPCSNCARLIVDAGITRVVLHTAPVDMGWDFEDLEVAREILESGGVNIIRVDVNPETLPGLLTRGEKQRPGNKKVRADNHPHFLR